MQSKVQLEKKIEKPKTIDIAEADVIVAVGRGLQSQNDLTLVQEFADKLGRRWRVLVR